MILNSAPVGAGMNQRLQKPRGSKVTPKTGTATKQLGTNRCFFAGQTLERPLPNLVQYKLIGQTILVAFAENTNEQLHLEFNSLLLHFKWTLSGYECTFKCKGYRDERQQLSSSCLTNTGPASRKLQVHFSLFGVFCRQMHLSWTLSPLCLSPSLFPSLR